MTTDEYKLPGGWVIRVVDNDLWGNFCTFELVGTPFWIVRTPTGWRAQVTPRGKQRRRYVTEGTQTAGQAVASLLKWGHLHGLVPPPKCPH